MTTTLDPHDLADRLAYALHASGFALEAYDPDFIAFRDDAGRRYLILQAATAFDRMPKLSQLGNVEVLVLGGGKEVAKRLAKARPFVSQGRVYLFHLDDQDEGGGVSRVERTTTKLGTLLSMRHSLPEVDESQRAAMLAAGQQRVQHDAGERVAFQQLFGRRQPVVTYTLLALIGVFFGLELLWGGSENTATLLRMGALVRERAFDEPWRLLSCTFLHAGLMHLLFNAYVLFALGSSLERILGHERFAVLYVTSAIGGSLASTMFLHEGLSVGASGAIWGLLAAEAVLALRPGGLLPASAIPAIKRAALINLGINVVNSFRPQVDWAAHFGGGAIGGLIMITGLLTLGLPKLAESSGEQAPVDRKPGWLRPAALVLGAMLVVGGVLGPILGKPWAMTAPPTYAVRSVGDSGFSVELPSQLQETQRQQVGPGQLMMVYGDPVQDQVVVSVFAMRIDPPMGDAELDVEVAGMEEALGQNLPPGAVEQGRYRLIVESDRRLGLRTFRAPNGALVERVGVVAPTFGGVVEAGVLPPVRGVYQGLAERTARSLTP